MMMTKVSGSSAAAGSSPVPRRKRKKLAASQKYEVFTSMLTSSATQRELAEKYGVDRTTIRSICATAKQGALDALAASAPGRRGKTAEQIELEDVRAENERLKATICEQAVALHLEQGKDAWD